MALVSMKTDEAMGMEAPEPNPYGYGLCLHLSSDQCEALGITQPLAAGAVVMLTARAFVKSATGTAEEEGGKEGPDVHMALQITDMELKPQAAGKFYENSDMNP